LPTDSPFILILNLICEFVGYPLTIPLLLSMKYSRLELSFFF